MKSAPARRSQIFRSPPQIELCSVRDSKFASLLKVIDSGGNRVDLDNVGVDTNDPKRTLLESTFVRGQYKIRFRVLSVDGHIVEDEFSFTIRDTQRTP